MTHFLGGDRNGTINPTGLVEFLTPTLIGTGTYRSVYSMVNTGPDRQVVKIAHQWEGIKAYRGIQSNIFEFETWISVKSDPKLKHLATLLCPVLNISDCGKFLIMRRTEPVTQSQYKSFLKTLPDIINSDIHIDNVGRLKASKGSRGRIVIIDYGTPSIAKLINGNAVTCSVIDDVDNDVDVTS